MNCVWVLLGQNSFSSRCCATGLRLPDLLTQITKLLRNLPTAVAVGVSPHDRCRDRSGLRNRGKWKRSLLTFWILKLLSNPFPLSQFNIFLLQALILSSSKSDPSKNFAINIYRPVLDNPMVIGPWFRVVVWRSYAQSKLINGRQSKGKGFTHKWKVLLLMWFIYIGQGIGKQARQTKYS